MASDDGDGTNNEDNANNVNIINNNNGITSHKYSDDGQAASPKQPLSLIAPDLLAATAAAGRRYFNWVRFRRWLTTNSHFSHYHQSFSRRARVCCVCMCISGRSGRSSEKAERVNGE